MAGKLLARPMEGTERSECRFSRLSPDYVNKSDVFKLQPGSRNYQRQYFYVYGKRLESLRPRVEAAVKGKLGKKAAISRLSDLDSVGSGNDVVVVGTLFKNQSMKPNILKEVGEENAATHDNVDVVVDKYIDDSDELVLEDELQRARLFFSDAVDVSKLVTGIVCGVLGRILPTDAPEGGGKFHAKSLVFAEPAAAAVDRPLPEAARFVAFVSGLELSGPGSSASAGSLELAASWLTGEAGEMDDQEANSAVERLVIAGNSLAADTKDRKVLSTAKYLTTGQDAMSVEAVSGLDDVLFQLAGSVDVDLMPGPNDPANQNMPQQPMHKCLFPRASRYPTFHSVTNPYKMEVCGQAILGTAGQNVDDIRRNSRIDDPIEALERIVTWSHVAPTCPDTLGMFPYQDQDPFVIDTMPNVVFAANQDKFGQKLLTMDGLKKSVLLLSIPKFAQTRSIVMLNMHNMKAHTIEFDYLDGQPSSPVPDK